MDTENLLLRQLIHEIELDGGCSYISILGDKNQNHLIPKLLSSCRSNDCSFQKEEESGQDMEKKKIKKITLVSFLERFPSLFRVHRSLSSPHTVRLTLSYENEDETFRQYKKHPYELSIDEIQALIFQPLGRERKGGQDLYEACCKALLKRFHKIRSRKEQRQKDKGPSEYPFATLDWLGHQVQSELHSYWKFQLLLNRVQTHQRPYQHYQLVGTQGWWDIALPVFLNFIKSLENSVFYVIKYNTDDDEQGRNTEWKALGLMYGIELMETVHRLTLTNTDKKLSQSCSCMNATIQNHHPYPSADTIERIISRIRSVFISVVPNPLPVGGIDLGRFFYFVQLYEKLRKIPWDQTLQYMLQGYSLQELSQLAQYQDYFQGITLIVHSSTSALSTHRKNDHDEDPFSSHGKPCENSRIYICCSELFTADDQRFQYKDDNVHKNIDDDTRRSLNPIVTMPKRRLKTDDTGHFSLTSSKCANAMASLLVRVLGGDDCDNYSQRRMPLKSQRVFIDMTAGIGSNAIAALRLFDQVVAIEKDAERALLLRENLNCYHQDKRCTVQVVCADSLLTLSTLAATFGGGTNTHVKCQIAVTTNTDGEELMWKRVVFLDPPWGGIHYRDRSKNTNEDMEVDYHDYQEDRNLGLHPNTPLSDVVRQIYCHLSPCILGIKVPLTFNVNAFRKRLGEVLNPNPNSFEVKSIKRFDRQLFVVLALHGDSIK